MQYQLHKETFELAFPSGAFYDLAEAFGDGSLSSLGSAEAQNKLTSRVGLRTVAEIGQKWAAKRDGKALPTAAQIESLHLSLDCASQEESNNVLRMGRPAEEDELEEDIAAKGDTDPKA